MKLNLKLSGIDRTNWNWKYLIFILIMLIPFGWTYYKKHLYTTIDNSIQFLLIGFGTIGMIFFIVLRMINKPNVSNLGFETAKLYFSTTINFMLASYAAFGIAFSILWGNLYTLAIEKVYLDYIERLKGQGFNLLIFIIISSLIILFTFLLPLLKQINDKERHKRGN